jgi:hypothetical protein
MKVPPALYGRASAFDSLAEQLKDEVDQLRREKQTTFESQSEQWRNSDPGHHLEEEIVLLEDLHDALKTILRQMKDIFTPEP